MTKRPTSDLTAYQRDLLAVIVDEPGQTGQDYDRRVENVRQERTSHERIYRNLGELVDRDLVDVEEVDGRTNAYRPTGDGMDLILDDVSWLLERIEE